MFRIKNTISGLLVFGLSTVACAHEGSAPAAGMDINQNRMKPVYADSHAPIGVMAEHMHKAGEWMLSYRFKHMSMQDNLMDDSSVTPEKIVTTVPNRFFGLPMQPPTLRVVPVEMTMDMHMFGGMYAPTDWLTLMLMGMYMEKSMDHVTFAGPAGTTSLGTFTTVSAGFGDTRLTGMFRLYNDGMHRLQLNAGLSLPTGSTTECDTILTPLGTMPTTRLPYPMQLGSGTYDLLPGLVYGGQYEAWGWGAQYTGTFRIGTNSEQYSLGDKHMITAWGSYRWQPWLSTSVRLEAEYSGRIDGIDPEIVAPVQTADPDNQGGRNVSLLFGFNLAGQPGLLRGHRLALEGGFPVYQNLNGPQMESEFVLTAGWQYAF